MYLSLSQEPVFFYLIATPMYTVRCKKDVKLSFFFLGFLSPLKNTLVCIVSLLLGVMLLGAKLYYVVCTSVCWTRSRSCFSSIYKLFFKASFFFFHNQSVRQSLSLSKIVAETLRFECSMGVFVQIAASQAKTYCKRVLSQLFIQSSNLKHCNL